MLHNHANDLEQRYNETINSAIDLKLQFEKAYAFCGNVQEQMEIFLNVVSKGLHTPMGNALSPCELEEATNNLRETGEVHRELGALTPTHKILMQNEGFSM